jgi:APA family basic amino acid/polyamine antiporter
LTHATPPDLPRRIGFWGASAVMVGVIIGSGIFRTPAAIAQHVGDPWIVLLFWLAGGVLSLFGALTYAELAAMHPSSGGVYVFLREGYGRCVAFVFGWTFMLISKPLAAAGIAVIFGEHVNRLLGTNADERLITVLILAVLTTINIIGVRLGSGVAVVLTSIKLGALLGIIALGAVIIPSSDAHFVSAPAPRPLLDAIMPVMAGVLWTFDGWSDVGAIAGEVKNPQKQLPRIYLAGTIVVTLVYLAVNAVYMLLVPLEEMRGMKTVADTVVLRLLGGFPGLAAASGTAVILIVLTSTLGSTHSSILTGARVTFAQSRDGLLFSFLSYIHPRFETPAVALLVQLALSCAATWFVQTFERLTAGFVFTMWIFYGLAGASIFILRAKQRDVERPFRCPGYPVVPAVFVLSAAAMTVLSIRDNPIENLIWLGVLLCGVPAYFLWNFLRERAARK